MKTHHTVPKSKGSTDMKFILMMNATKAGFESYAKWPKQDLEANIAFMRTFNKQLKEEESS